MQETKRITDLLDRLRDAAIKRRQPFLNTKKEIAQYAYNKTYDFMYNEASVELFFKAKVAKAAEFQEIMGAALYPTNPKASVLSRDWATPEQRARHKLEVQYLDYATYQGDLYAHMRRCMNDALIGGRAVLWTSFNERKNIVQSTFDTVENFLMDPDARIPDEANWVARRRFKPRWWLAKQYPNMKDAISKMEKTTERKSDSKASGETASDIIEYWEMYFRVGVANYAPSLMGVEVDDPEFQALQSDDPIKLCVTRDTILSAEPWEIPFWRIDKWPCEWLDLREKPGDLWPAAPMETGIGHLKALNWIYTLYLSKMRTTTRTPLIVAKYNGQGLTDDEAMKILKGKDFDIIRLTINGEILKLSDLVQQFKFDSGVEEFERFSSIVGREFEKSTGLYEVLYTGTTPTQIRNATTAELIRNNSSSRVDDMRNVTEKFMGAVYCKTLFAARYLHTPEDVGRMFGPEAAMLWGTLAPPEMVAQEQQMRQQTGQQMAQMGMPPEQIQAQLGPEQLVDLDAWVNEAAREIVGGSMRPLSHQNQVDNLNVALNQLAPAVVTLPGGAEFVAAISYEFARLNRYSQEFQDAARKFYQQASAVTDMQVMVASQPPPPQGTPPAGPKSGPEGGHNQETG